MKITFVLPFAGLTGGIRVLAIYAQRLQARGHEVTVVSTPRPHRTFAGRLRTLVRRGHWPTSPPTGATYFDGINVSHRVIASHRPVCDDDVPDADVVVATWWATAPWVSALCPEKGVKAYFVQDYGGPGQAMSDVAPTWSLPMHLITISHWLRRLIGRHTAAPVDIVPNGVDAARFDAPPRRKRFRPTFGMVYARSPNKGSHLVLEAIARARRRIPEIALVGFGPCPPPEPIRTIDEADFGWNLSEDELPGVYRQCDAWLFGTRREGFGLPMLEAMACRTPVIATPAGAAPQLVEGGGGVLVEHDNPVAMSTAIQWISRMSDANWQRLSGAAYATARTYTWDRAVQRFESALLHALDRARRGEIEGGSSSLHGAGQAGRLLPMTDRHERTGEQA